MTYKLRRPPLLVYDNGRHIYPHCYDQRHVQSASRSSVVQLDCSLATSTPSPNSTTGPLSCNGGSGPSSSSSLATAANQAKTTMTTTEPRSSPSKLHQHKDLHVNFDTGKVDVKEKKTKFLTAKYGTHQMNLIKKRLSVEMWMYDELQYLFNSTDDCEVELDLDELLDISGEAGKKNWLLEKLVDAKRSQEEVKKFIDDLLAKAKTL